MVGECTKRFQGIQRDTKGTLNKTEWYANVTQNGMRKYNEVLRNTAIFQGIQKNTIRFQGIQGTTKGKLNRTYWYANVQRDSKEYTEIPRNT